MTGKWKCIRDGAGFWLIDESSDRRIFFHGESDSHAAGEAVRALLRPK
jgi:hypothetical protein